MRAREPVLRRIACLWALLISCSVFAQASNLELNDRELAWLEQHPVIRVHNEMEWPPHNFNVDGQPTGFSIDYMNLIAGAAGLIVEYISGPSWDEFKEMIQSDELDVMLNMSINYERQEYVIFTKPYSQMAVAVFVKDPALDIRSFNDLSELKVSATRGFSTEEYLATNHPDVELVLEDDLLGTLYAVLEGRADATMDDYSALNYLIQQRALPGLRLAYLSNDPEISERPAIGVRKDWPILRDILQKAIDSLDEAEVDELRKKWLGVEDRSASADAPAEFSRAEITKFTIIVMILLFGAVVTYLFVRLMRGQGEKKSVLILLIIMLLGSIGAELFVLKLYNDNNKLVAAAELNRFKSLQLMDLLRQTSDDLTKMARNYALTGEQRFENYFNQILSIRSGMAPRPLEYNRVYWDFVVASGRAPRESGDATSMLDLLEQQGFSGEELSRLRQAEKASSRLAIIEQQAMNAVKGVFRDDNGEFTIFGDTDQQLASELLYGEAYNRAKADIMRHIDEATSEVDRRTQRDLTELGLVGQELQMIAIPLAIISLIVVGVVLLLATLWMGSPSDKANEESASTAVSRRRTFAQVLLRSWPLFVAATIAAAFVAGLIWRNAMRLEADEYSSLQNQLTAVLTTTSSATDQWFREREQEVSIWARRLQDSGLIDRLQRELPAGAAGANTIHAAIRAVLQPVVVDKGYIGYIVLRRDGTVVASNRQLLVGTRIDSAVVVEFASSALLPPGFSSVVLPTIFERDSLSVNGGALMLFGAAAIEESREPEFVLAFIIDPDREFTAILQRGRVGESGESYAFNAAGQLISESRFDDDLRAIGLIESNERGILNIDIRDPGGNMGEGYQPGVEHSEHPLTKMAAAATAGVDGTDVLGYNDYRGVPVVGAWRWNAAIGYGITSEMDVSEATASIVQIRDQALTTIVVVLALLFGLTSLFVINRYRMGLAHMRVERASEQTNQILENATDGIFTIDDSQRVVRFNPEAERIWGYTAAEVLGNEMTMLIPEHARKGHLANVHRFRDADTSGVAMQDRGLKLFGLTKDGRTFPAEVGISKALTDGEIQYTAFVKDITEREKTAAELQAAYSIIKKHSDRMEQELSVGHDIQMSMVPLLFPAFPDRPEFGLHAVLKPAREVGGDFYDFFFVDDEHICLVVGDVSGKGVPAALFMAVTKTMIKSQAVEDPSPASIATRVNDELSADNPASMFVTLFIAIVNTRSGEFRYTNAGHNPPYILRSNGELECVNQRHGPIVGAVEGVAYREDRGSLAESDSLLIYTDGVTEAMNQADELYTENRLAALLTNRKESPEEITNRILGDVAQFAMGADQADDITILAYRSETAASVRDIETLSMSVAIDLKDIERVNSEFAEVATNRGISQGAIQKVSIVFDELLTNVISYGFDDDKKHEITIDVSYYSDHLLIVMSDDGIPFNPFDHVGTDTSLSLDERKAGGLGVLLVSEIMDECHYQRHMNKNSVTMTLKLHD